MNTKRMMLSTDSDGNVIGKIPFNEITNYNFDGLCSQEKCLKRYTHTCQITINGVRLIIPVCDEHAKEMERSAEEYFK